MMLAYVTLMAVGKLLKLNPKTGDSSRSSTSVLGRVACRCRVTARTCT